MWHYLGSKKHKIWIWKAYQRETDKIIGGCQTHDEMACILHLPMPCKTDLFAQNAMLRKLLKTEKSLENSDLSAKNAVSSLLGTHRRAMRLKLKLRQSDCTAMVYLCALWQRC